MKKIIFGLVSLLMVSSLFAGQGKIRVSCDKEGAYVYVDGKKKAMIGEGFTSILLEEGEYAIKVSKPIDEKYEYAQSKKVFVGVDTSVKLSFKLKKQKTAKADAAKLARWQRSGEVVTDIKLGLMWQDNSAAKNTKKKWKSAKKYCQELSFGGYHDWRLPSYDELLTIVVYDRFDPAIMPSFKNVNTSRYWSSSQFVNDMNEWWYVNFNYGRTGTNVKRLDFYVRCVRVSQ